MHALTAAYTLLSRESWSNVQLEEIITEELRPFMADSRTNIRQSGPAVSLQPRGALAIGMAIHELATNAAKYGALSVPEGDVGVTWRLEHDGDVEHLVLDWIEQNGPAVTEPDRRGFGTVMIKRGIAHDLQGEAQVLFPTEGVRARIRVPMPRVPEPPMSVSTPPVP